MLPTLAKEVIALSGGCDPAVAANAGRIVAELRREETKFGSTLEAGIDPLPARLLMDALSTQTACVNPCKLPRQCSAACAHTC